MRRGTTPTLKIKVIGMDVALFKSVYITIKQGSKELTKTNGDIEIKDGNILSVFLDQEDTLKFLGGHVDIQLRAVTDNGLAVASDIKRMSMERVLKDGVIT